MRSNIRHTNTISAQILLASVRVGSCVKVKYRYIFINFPHQSFTLLQAICAIIQFIWMDAQRTCIWRASQTSVSFFFSLSSWTHSMRCCTFKILRIKRTSMWRRCCLPQNWNQAVHTERIFIEFSRGTSINVELTSHTREPKAMSN